jgi:hypothetical protein
LTARRRILAALGGFGLASITALSQRPPLPQRKPPKKKKVPSHRFGKLRAGDQAPDFDLKVLKSEERVRLSSFFGKMPVALVFGSYT